MVSRRAAASILLTFFSAHAQSALTAAPPPTHNLENLAGLTAVQKPMAVAIQWVCYNLSTITRTRTPEQTKLFDSCDKMVQTANVLAGQSFSPEGVFVGDRQVFFNPLNLELSNEQLRTAVQAAGSEESGSMAGGSLKTAGSNPVGGRLLALRAGAHGFTLASNGDTLSSASGGAAGESDGDGRLGGFANFSYNLGDVDGSELEDGFEFSSYGLVTGLDYRFSDSLVAGGALSYYRNNADFDASLGKVDASNFGVSAYGSYYIMGDGHIDATLSYSRHDYDTVRNIVVPSFNPAVVGIDTQAVGSTNGDQFSLSVAGGYDFRYDTITLTPSARLSYLKLDVDGYSEYEPVAGLGLDIADQTVTSLQSALGVHLSKTVSTSAGVFVPYGAIEWIHEFDNDASSITAKYTNDPFNIFFVIPTISPDRNYFMVSVGGSSVFANGIAAFVTLESVLGLEGVNNTGLTVGLRKEF